MTTPLRDEDVEHLRQHLTDGAWHDKCFACLRRREKGGTGIASVDAALADRLLPPVVSERVERRMFGPLGGEYGCCTREIGDDSCPYRAKHSRSRLVQTLEDGRVLTGLWEEAK